jgi:hypothetical protein
MLAQARRQVAIELHHREPPEAFHQRLGEGRQARTDFHHGLAGPRADLAHDRGDDALVGQEVLAEALARDVPQARVPERSGWLETLERRLAHFDVGARAQVLRPLRT